MNQNNEQKGFSYTYSAKEQAEIKKIRDKYVEKAESEDKITRLRRLDRNATQKAQIIALTLGIIGALILGAGMSIFMTDFGSYLNMSRVVSMVVGISMGIVGGTIAGIAYPVFNAVLKKERQKIAPEIIKLSDELIK